MSVCRIQAAEAVSGAGGCWPGEGRADVPTCTHTSASLCVSAYNSRAQGVAGNLGGGVTSVVYTSAKCLPCVRVACSSVGIS